VTFWTVAGRDCGRVHNFWAKEQADK
jgi:hypothetical protein